MTYRVRLADFNLQTSDGSFLLYARSSGHRGETIGFLRGKNTHLSRNRNGFTYSGNDPSGDHTISP